jgi:DNA-binding MarR family transcriptional regulator
MTTDGPPGMPRAWQGALGNALRRARVSYRRHMDAELAAAGFAERRFPEGRVLAMCSRPGETTISDVGRGLGITRQGASKIVAEMRERGYLAVTLSATDGREKILTLTPRAIEFLTVRRNAADAFEARLRDKIGDDEIEHLFRLLDAVAGDEPVTPDALRGDTPAIRALRWWDAEER